MGCKSFWKRVVSFILAFTIALCVVNLAKQWNSANENQKKIIISQNVKSSKKIIYPKEESGSGCGECSLNQQKELTCFVCNDGKFKPSDKFKSTKNLSSKTRAIQILAKPHPKYTVEARANFIEGDVLLRVVFLANGEIGNITPVKELPFGLTEQAIEAAKKIKFEPMIRNGQTTSVTKQVQYSFTIY
jgi:TonB family protein